MLIRKLRCPTPRKVAYRDRETAERWARGGRPYTCRCGRWHITTKARSDA